MAHSPEPPVQSAASAIIDQNIEATLAMRNAEELALSRHQRAIEHIVALIAVPAFLFMLLVVVASWIGVNLWLIRTGQSPWDKPPFGWLQTGVSLLAVVMTSIVVITQHRQVKTAERNAHIDLQISLVIDQKAAKIIQLLEEMRADSPHLRNRRDLEAEDLQLTTDPAQVASIIDERMSGEFVERLEDSLAGDPSESSK